MGEALDLFSKALASGASRRSALAGLLIGATAVLPWTAEAKKKKKKRKKKFKKYQEFCNEWCGAKFELELKSLNECVNKAKEGQGPCYSSGPGFYCENVLKCGEDCCPTIIGGDPVKDGSCCTGECVALNGTCILT